MESWGSFASGGQPFFFSDEPDGSSSSMGGELGLSEILCSSNNGGLVSPNSSESVSRASNNSLKSSLITLKLGRAMAATQGSPSSSATKKARTRGCYSQTTAFCQVLGCNLDLSGSKDYHKKHKVCDVHSKTPKVVVNGVEQRFCQQCSRFHLLPEFDDGKRSCRRRLAGHNERRRKPQFDGLSERKHRFSRSYHQGCLSSPSARYPGNPLQKRTPFVFSDILPSAFMSSEKVNHFDDIKFGDHPVFSTNQFAPPFPEARYLQPHWAEKQQYDSEIAPGETEDNFLYSASNSPCALSLLSVQSQSFSSRPNEAPAATSPPMPRPEVYSCGTNSVGADQLEPMGLFTASHAGVDFDVVADRSFRGSGSTVNLLQLSSHLQRVEHQRSFSQVKQENDEFCRFQTA